MRITGRPFKGGTVLIRVVVQNLARGGLRNAGGHPQDRWPQLAARIGAAGPDLVLLNEVRRWEDDDHRQLAHAMSDLDLDLVPLPPSKTGHRSAMLYRRQSTGRWIGYGHDLGQETTHGFVTATFAIAGLDHPLTVVACHLDPYSGDKAMYEAALVAARGYRHGPYAILGGDFNHPPEAGPEPEYQRMKPFNLSSRTLLTDPAVSGPPQPDRRSAWILAKSGYLDAAWHLYQQTGDQRLLRRTGNDDRIDRLHVTRPLGPCIVDYQVLDEPADASDHHGIAVTLDTSRIHTSAAPR
jgi:endonuclease/exonuclease/phosphatase family metal-dependent hydrolase